MPDGLLEVVALLTLGYILLLLELFVPGGILGVLGGLSILYGTYLAFGMSTIWGVSALFLSVVVTIGIVVGFVRSRAAKKLVLDNEFSKDWKASEDGLESLLGQRGETVSPLRPAGYAMIGERRLDVVSDSEFLEAGVEIEVVEIEGNRVVVEAVVDSESHNNSNE